MGTRTDRSSNEAEIRQLVDSRVQALYAKDVNAAMSPYAPDLLLFDLAPPLQYFDPGGDRVCPERTRCDRRDHRGLRSQLVSDRARAHRLALCVAWRSAAPHAAGGGLTCCWTGRPR
jgi:hypothetical protein